MADRTEVTGSGALADILMQLAGNNRLILDATSGYKAACEEHGFSPTAAEMMAMEYHAGLMRAVFK